MVNVLESEVVMKRAIKNSVVLIFSLGILASGTLFFNLPVKAANTVPVYRLESRLTGENLYTTDINEVRVLSSSRVWENEGIEWYAPDTGEGIYRLNNPGGYHLYSKDRNEIKTLKKMGWTVDNGNKPMFYSGGNVNVYRVYNKWTGIHFLTADMEDYMEHKAKGWNDEGVALKAVSGEDYVEPSGNGNASSGSELISRDVAIQKALERAGVSKSNVRHIKAEYDYEDDYVRIGKNPHIYEVEFKSGNYEYDIVVDAYTGEIIKYEREYDD